MGIDDKIENKGQELYGKADQKVGSATDDRSRQAQGVADEAEGKLKQVGENIKDALDKD